MFITAEKHVDRILLSVC